MGLKEEDEEDEESPGRPLGSPLYKPRPSERKRPGQGYSAEAGRAGAEPGPAACPLPAAVPPSLLGKLELGDQGWEEPSVSQAGRMSWLSPPPPGGTCHIKEPRAFQMRGPGVRKDFDWGWKGRACMPHISDINKFPLTKGQAPLPLLFVWGFRWGKRDGFANLQRM